ncbi:MAG: prephenate dehydratase [Firmicutes bacterium]|nr:prephenate dehydratase [Bacillota bacterium]
MKVAYLGPDGTFSRQAADILCPDSEKIPFSTFTEVLGACQDGKADQAVVPIENSIEGVVNASIDELVFEKELYIQEILNLPIEQNLMAKKGTRIEDVKKIISHSHAIPQCKNFLKTLPEAVIETVSSTGEGARLASIAEGNNVAAVGNKAAADIYGLEILKSSIQDNKNNITRFARVSATPTIDYENKQKQTIAFSTLDEPGALYGVLEIFSVYGINLSDIFSRPMKNRLKEYVFVVDIDINNNIDDIKQAIKLMERKSSFIKVLGIYSEISP